jgi:hypothetical protein
MQMIRTNNGNHIHSVEDWFTFSPPAKGVVQWKDGRSAKELAKAWFRTGKAEMPTELTALLDSCPLTKNFRLLFGTPEMETVLDDFRGSGRIHDMILVGEADDKRVLVSIEAKVDESFGELIGEYIVKSTKANERSQVPNRIAHLSKAIFGEKDTSALRYQLLHAVAGTLIEARNQAAKVAVFVMYEFIPPKGKSEKAIQNEKDVNKFVMLLSDNKEAVKLEKLMGPFRVPGGGRIPADIPLYIGKVETQM